MATLRHKYGGSRSRSPNKKGAKKQKVNFDNIGDQQNEIHQERGQGNITLVSNEQLKS